MATEQNNGLSVLAFDGARLAFPLGEVLGVQRSSQIEAEQDNPLALGGIVHAGRRWPVFALDGGFNRITMLPAERPYCVCVSADGGETGLALMCDTVNGVSLEAQRPPPVLPECLRAPHSPLRQWYRLGEQIVPITSAPALADYLRHQLGQ